MNMQKVSKRADPNHIFIHPEVKVMLERNKTQVIEKDWDRVFLIDGGEGSGKSLLGLQIAKYLDPSFNLDRVCFNAKEFSEAIDKAKKFQCIVFDEAFNGLASSAAMSQMNRFIVRKLMECRQKNLFIIVILPTFFLLQKYVAIFRSKALFHVFADKYGNRGLYRVYNESNKKFLYLNGLKYYSYGSPRLKRVYHFGGKYPISEEDYRKKKHDALTENEDQDKKREIKSRYIIMLSFLFKFLKDQYKISYTQLSKMFKDKGIDYSSTSIARIVQENPT